MKAFLDSMRAPKKGGSLPVKLICGIGFLVLGLLVGVLQKRLDATAANELPLILQRLDLTNYFGRISVWILLGTVISVYSKTPLRAGINAFMFFAGMIAGYYLYSKFVLGFYSLKYLLIWSAVALASFFLAYVCWYAKGRGFVRILISGAILGVLFSQAFFILQGFRIAHITEVITWAVGIIVLFRKPKEFAVVLGVSLITALICQLTIPYYG